MVRMVIIPNPFPLNIEGRFVKQADYIKQHGIAVFDLKNNKPRPKPALNSNKEQSACVDTLWWWSMHDIRMYIFPLTSAIACTDNFSQAL